MVPIGKTAMMVACAASILLAASSCADGAKQNSEARPSPTWSPIDWSKQTPSSTSSPSPVPSPALPVSDYTLTCGLSDYSTKIFQSIEDVWKSVQPGLVSYCKVAFSPARKPLPGEAEALTIARGINNGNSDADNLEIMLGLCANVPSTDGEVSANAYFIAGAAKLCPGAPHAAILRGDVFYDGQQVVARSGSVGVKPGTYRGAAEARNCYWERTTSSGETIANNFITYAPSGAVVTIAGSDGGFVSRNCGPWKRVS